VRNVGFGGGAVTSGDAPTASTSPAVSAGTTPAGYAVPRPAGSTPKRGKKKR